MERGGDRERERVRARRVRDKTPRARLNEKPLVAMERLPAGC